MTVKNTESGTTYRNRLCKSIVLSIRKIMQKGAPDSESLDMAAFIVLALEKITESVDSTASAWEKRDYWLKADRFRMEWDWIDHSQNALHAALLERDWIKIAPELVTIAQHLGNVKVAERNRLGEPWIGAWKILKNR
jgi:hypothetical protein